MAGVRARLCRPAVASQRKQDPRLKPIVLIGSSVGLAKSSLKTEESQTLAPPSKPVWIWILFLVPPIGDGTDVSADEAGRPSKQTRVTRATGD